MSNFEPGNSYLQ